MTQEELANAIGAARTSVTNLERGRQHFPLHVLLEVADRLEIELCELIPRGVQLTDSSDGAVPFDVGGGVRMLPPRTASVISNIWDRRKKNEGDQNG